MSAIARKHTVSEFMAEFKLSRSKTYELIAQGALIIVKVGEKTLIINADDWLAGLPRGVMAQPKALRHTRSACGVEHLDI
jgi:hypothetical protein